MKSLLFSLLGLVFGFAVMAQELKIAPVFGPSVSFAGYSKAYRDVLKNDFPELIKDAGGQGKVHILPAVRIQIGGLLDYSLSEVLSVQTGLLFNLRGHSIRMKVSGNGGTGKAVGKVRVSYLELPLWGKYKMGESGFNVSVGPTFGVALGGKLRSKYSIDGESESETESLSIGNDEGLDDVKPLDVSLNLGLAKQISVGEHPLEVSLNIQPSLTKWTVSSNSEYNGRHITVGIRAAYFFGIK